MSSERLNSFDVFTGVKRLHFVIFILVIMTVLFVLYGKPSLWGNEFVYILRLNPYFLVNDWSFSVPANEHWLFNTLFGPLAHIFSFVTTAWIGRIFTWLICTVAFFKIGRLYGTSTLFIGISLVLWLLIGQMIVNDEWIFGGFEAKTVAYCCLLPSLFLFATKRTPIIASVLLGLTFSFHPAVGLWAILGVGVTLLVRRTPIRELMTVIGVTFIFALPGIIPALQEFTRSENPDNWKFITVIRFPFHFDPHYIERRTYAVLFILLASNIFMAVRRRSDATDFLTIFQISLFLFFLLAVFFRKLELYSLLSLMPMRLYPVFAPLFFFFALFSYLFSKEHFVFKIALLAICGLILFIQQPEQHIKYDVKNNLNEWFTPADDFKNGLIWVSKNTIPDSLLCTEPGHKETWFFARQPQIASYSYPLYDRLTEWRKRVTDMTGVPLKSDQEVTVEQINQAFNDLPPERVEELRTVYGCKILMSRGTYDYRLLTQAGAYKIYDLSENSYKTGSPVP